MKLTVAMGLQYDNGKSNQMYALTLGGGRGRLKQMQKTPVAALATAQQHMHTVIPDHRNALFILSYNPEGTPVPFVLDSGSINLFA